MSTPNKTFRLAVLECDDPLEDARRKLGGHTACFKILFREAATKFGEPLASFVASLDITKWDVVYEQKYPDLSSVDAILVSGARFSVYDTDPWIGKLASFVRDALRRDRVQVIGVCFGHQMIAHCLGSNIRRNENGWETSVSEISLTARGRDLFGKESLSLHLLNRDIVSDLPPGVEGLAFTPKTKIHAMYIPGKLITVQGHPEFTDEISRDILYLRNAAGTVDDLSFEDGIARLGRPSDGVYVAKAALDMLQESTGVLK